MLLIVMFSLLVLLLCNPSEVLIASKIYCRDVYICITKVYNLALSTSLGRLTVPKRLRKKAQENISLRIKENERDQLYYKLHKYLKFFYQQMQNELACTQRDELVNSLQHMIHILFYIERGEKLKHKLPCPSCFRKVSVIHELRCSHFVCTVCIRRETLCLQCRRVIQLKRCLLLCKNRKR